jgi:hypothetical protein
MAGGWRRCHLHCLFLLGLWDEARLAEMSVQTMNPSLGGWGLQLI